MSSQEPVNSVENEKMTAVSWEGGSSDADYDALKGNEVRTSDDYVIGTVTAVYHPNRGDDPDSGAHYFLVEPSHLTGPGGAGPLYMPETAIGAVTGEGIQIPWSRDGVENQGWASKPLLIDRYRRS